MKSQQKRTLTLIFACVIIYIKIRDRSSSTTSKCFNDILSQDIGEMTGREMVHYVYLSNSSSCRIIHDYGGKLAKFYNGFGEIVNMQSVTDGTVLPPVGGRGQK